MYGTYTITDEPFALAFLSEPSSNITKKTAAGFKALFDATRPEINPETGMSRCDLGTPAAIRFQFGAGIFADNQALQKKKEDCPEKADEYDRIYKEMLPYIASARVRMTTSQYDLDLMTTYPASGGYWLGHANPNYADFAKYGTDGLREKVRYFAAKNPQANEFYEGLLTFLDGFDILAQRLREQAEEMLPTLSDANEIRKVRRIVSSLEHCPKQPANSFVEAVIVFNIVFSFEGIDSPGRFDQYMIEFWRSTDAEESREILDDLWQFFHETRTWNLTISGSDEFGNDQSNELTYEILALTEKYHYQTPNLTMRCHRNSPEKLLRAAAKALATGCGLPGLYNDEVVCPALERLGIPPEDSHNYVMNGCNQFDIQGKSHMGLEDGGIDLAKAVEYTFTRGVDAYSGKKLGCDTPDPETFETFEEFYRAVKDQMHLFCLESAQMANKSQIAISSVFSDPMRSLTIAGCLEKGLEYKNRGPLYGHGQILLYSISNAVDSIYAVKKYVFEDKRFTMKELRDALDADFEGYDEMYDVLAHSTYRFGNDIPEVDAIAKDLVDDCNRYLMLYPTFRGGFYGGGCSPFVGAEQHAVVTGALPSGKRKCKGPAADSIGATPGEDVNGPTALLNSCLCFDQTLAKSGFILNLKFDKTHFATETGIDNFLSLVKAYFGSGGQQLAVSVLSREELLDAVEHPELHRDLIVRVGGFSDYFIKISKDLQQNVIARTCHIL